MWLFPSRSCSLSAGWGSEVPPLESAQCRGRAVAGIRGQREQWRDRHMPAVATGRPPLFVGADAIKSPLSVPWVW